MAQSETPSPDALRGTSAAKMIGAFLDALSKVAAALIALFASYSAVVGQGREQTASFAIVLAALAVLIWRLWPTRPLSIAVPGIPAIRGLAAFNESDGSRLFGRDTEVGALLGKVENDQWRVCLLQGEPSSGKTSLLRAGLLPHLTGDVWLPVYVQVPQNDLNLLAEIRRELASAAGIDPGNLPLVELMRCCAEHTKKTPVIVCDQFERLLTSAAADDARTPLFEAMRLCLVATELNFRFVLSSRTGFGGAATLERGLDRALPLPSQITVSRLAPERAEEVLASMASHDNTPFSAGLRSAIVSDLTHDRTVCPAELQIVSMWVRDRGITTRPGYEGIGRATGSFREYIQAIVKSVDDVTSVGAARHILLLLAERSRSGSTRTDLLTGYGGPDHQTNVLEQEALDRALQHLVDNGIVMQVADGGYQLIHDYFARSISDALRGPASPWLAVTQAWWLARQVVTAYGLRSALFAVAALLGCAAAAVVLGAPGAQPRWALAGQSGTLDASALWAFDPQNVYLAADDGTKFVVWDLLPDRLLALDTPPRQPLRSIEHPPKPSGFVPISVGFLSDGSEAYEVSLNVVANRWRVDRVGLQQNVQSSSPLEGELSPPGDSTTCSPKAAAYSFAVDTLAVAYSCGQIVLLPSGGGLAKDVRVVAADEDKSCWPARIALSGSQKHLAVIYNCVDATALQTSKLRTWDVDLSRPQPVEWATVALDFAENNSIADVTFRWDGHVTVGVGSGADLSVVDVSTSKPVELVHNIGNRADPHLVWLGPDGRLAAVQADSNPPQLQLQAVDLWVGPLRVPPFLPFRRDVSGVSLSL